MKNLIRSIMLLNILCLIGGCSSQNEADFHPRQAHIKIVTYNVNWGFVNPDKVAEYLSSEAADIICLQETHRRWESFLKAHLSNEYPYATFYEGGAAGGIGIMSRYEILSAELILPEEGWFPALLCEVRTPIGFVQILNVHLRPPLSDQGTVSVGAYFSAEDIHCKELHEFIDRINKKQPLIILGDFNESEKSKAIRELIEQGFTDALSLYDKYINTWEWKVSTGIKLKNRYDHILYSRHLACTAAKVTPVDASDHFPLVAVIVSSMSNVKK
ncbi:MAG: endonuclease/exonuclease/phosphatase family protein [Sedimentisphaerales bacterium]|nr:endonuclease/exonuclease/phosphatase family protein [Sedimentisphaerales bacterium]